jgi:hypothetical protein
MQRGKRAKRAAGGSKSASGLPSYYEDYVQDGLRRYVELALIADHSIVRLELSLFPWAMFCPFPTSCLASRIA